ncbi:MAG: ABC transporter ATP-binding protein [Archaeoglobales archaeon]|nr:ABC transporter ATP-binding protein [Archaeoglobales archaeon]
MYLKAEKLEKLTSEESMPILSVSNLNAYYDKLEVLHNVSLKIEKGERVAVLGPNGAGKTTLLKAICGLVSYKGDIEFKGFNLNRLKPYERIKRGIAICPEGRRIFSRLSVEDNLSIVNRDTNLAYELFPQLRSKRREKAKNLSGGEQQMLAIARALLLKPELLLLDEPSMGLAPIVVESLAEVINSISKDVSILMVEQNMQLASDIAERCYILSSGRITYEGCIDEIDIKAYFK